MTYRRAVHYMRPREVEAMDGFGGYVFAICARKVKMGYVTSTPGAVTCFACHERLVEEVERVLLEQPR